MSADVLIDAWTTPCPDYAQTVMPPGGHLYKSASPIIGQKARDRPKSVPNMGSRGHRKESLSSHYTGVTGGSNRPKTALGTTRPQSCERVLQVEHEATRKHNLENHLGPKKTRAPPWQRNIDTASPVQTVVTPTYTLSRSKHKVAMTIRTDDFFNMPLGDNDDILPNPQRDALLDQLQQQIDDLTLYLEEERLNHRDTKRQASEMLQNRLEELSNQHENQLGNQENQHQARLSDLQESHQQEVDQLRDEAENTINKMRSEVEFLQGAFESYKSQLHQEMDERWRKREAEIRAQHEDMIQDKLKELRGRVQSERAAEKNDLALQHQRAMTELAQEHKREIAQIMRRFSNAAKELEQFKETKEELEEARQELETLKADYDNACLQVANVTRELTDMKVELATFQQTFQDRIEVIDDKYRDQIHELMAQNTQLRQLYMKKCGELFDEKTVTESTTMNRIRTTKEKMKYLIVARHDAVVSLAATDPALASRLGPPKQRPVSAPQTRGEREGAQLSAGETDEYVKRREQRAETCKPRILEQIQREREEQGS